MEQKIRREWWNHIRNYAECTAASVGVLTHCSRTIVAGENRGPFNVRYRTVCEPSPDAKPGAKRRNLTLWMCREILT
jgi:hypothetical protein